MLIFGVVVVVLLALGFFWRRAKTAH